MANKKPKQNKPKTGLARCLELASNKKGLVFLSAILSSLAAIASFVPYIAVYFIISSILKVYPNLELLDMSKVMNYGWIALAVGGGTAGMEAACTAAEVGCNVFVLEKKDHLGGLSTFISDLPSKTRMKDFPKYLEARAARLKNLYIFLNTDATVEKIRQFKPDIVVNATGSVPLVPPIKGLKENIEAGNVATIFDMINNLNAGKYPDEACQGKKVVVVGGGSVGLDVIEYFAPRGAECTIVDMLPQIGMLADPITKCSMRETHDKYGVREYVNTALQEVKENAFTVKLPDGQIKDLEFDFGFNCLGMRSNNPVLPQIEEAFKDTDTYVYTIGDSVRARRIMEGTMEGRAVLNVLESQGFLHLEPLE